MRLFKHRPGQFEPSWFPAKLEKLEVALQGDNNLQPDRRQSPRHYDHNLNKVWSAYRIVVARSKHKPNPGLDARAVKSAVKELRG